MGGILTAFVGSATSQILDPVRSAALAPTVLAAARHDLATGLFWIFVILAIAAVLALGVALRSMPAVRIGPSSQPAAAVDGPAVDRPTASQPSRAD